MYYQRRAYILGLWGRCHNCPILSLLLLENKLWTTIRLWWASSFVCHASYWAKALMRSWLDLLMAHSPLFGSHLRLDLQRSSRSSVLSISCLVSPHSFNLRTNYSVPSAQGQRWPMQSESQRQTSPEANAVVTLAWRYLTLSVGGIILLLARCQTVPQSTWNR